MTGQSVDPMTKDKWAQGIKPRDFTWVLKDRIAACERPGGYGSDHRKVRRHQEIIWIREQGFVVVSLCGATQNLHNYKELGVRYSHVPFDGSVASPTGLTKAMNVMHDHISCGDRIVVHREEFDERIMGLMAAYLLWTNLVNKGPEVLSIAEHLFRRELSQTAREIVALVDKCPPPERIGRSDRSV